MPTDTLETIKLALQYGPWGGMIALAILWFNSVLKSKKDVELVKSEYQRQRDDARTHFDEFREIYRQQREEASARFEAVVAMYEKNAELVKAYQKLADDQVSVLSLVIERLKEANEIARNNLYCPVERIRETRVLERGPSKQ